MYVFFFNFDPLVILKLSLTGKIDWLEQKVQFTDNLYHYLVQMATLDYILCYFYFLFF